MADDYITRLVTLTIANRPGPGRAGGRLRISLGRVLADLVDRYGVAPEAIRLSGVRGDAGLLRLARGDRVFLSPQQMEALGGFSRHGTKVRVKFLLPPRRHLLDRYYLDGVTATDDGELEFTAASGIGVTFRVSEVARGIPEERLEKMNLRLRKAFEEWLKGFPERWGILDGEENFATLTSIDVTGRRWMLQCVRRSRRSDQGVGTIAGTITSHTTLHTVFKVDEADFSVSRTGGTRALQAGDSFTVT